eukprot:COSAG01_NODE_4440_length_5021_cov_5.654409_3_plen_75_part_00
MSRDLLSHAHHFDSELWVEAFSSFACFVESKFLRQGGLCRGRERQVRVVQVVRISIHYTQRCPACYQNVIVRDS